ncbi:MAG: hypothetical protein HF973_04100 [Chloroflexi bacterium]|nr:hypothetical protein [Chloroflexota bacterium]
MIVWTDYMRYRARLRGFDLETLEKILLYATERYYDTETGRAVVIGRHNRKLIVLPYETNEDELVPITVHVITRRQINFRLKTGRFINE